MTGASVRIPRNPSCDDETGGMVKTVAWHITQLKIYAAIIRTIPSK